MKATIVGAGNVGATYADVISYRGIQWSSIIRYKEVLQSGKALWYHAMRNQYWF
jgi:Trk K+ transport system NAD-binding subunit